jgi:mono/diheme cytochrome c family protein
MKSDPKKSQSSRTPGTVPGSKLPAATSLAPVREGLEPTVGDAHVPMWIILVLGLVFYWGQLYLDQNAGQFHPRVHEPYTGFAHLTTLNPIDPEQAFFNRGMAVYAQACQVCHQPTGLGTPPAFPPLAGSEWVLTASGERAIRIALHGLQGPIEVLGQPYNAVMPAMGEALSDEDLAAAITYIRRAWGNDASAVTPEQVANARQMPRTRPWTGPELMQIQD